MASSTWNIALAIAFSISVFTLYAYYGLESMSYLTSTSNYDVKVMENNTIPTIIHTNYSTQTMANETLFKHGHENEKQIVFCDNFTVIYLVQGYSIFDISDWYKLMYENENNYMIFLYYNKQSFMNDTEQLLLLLNVVNKDRIKLLIITEFNTSYTQGRNMLLSYMFKYEHSMLNSHCHFNYVCLLDDDLELFTLNPTKNNIYNNLTHLNNNNEYNEWLNDFYFNFLDKYTPFVGIPYRYLPDWRDPMIRILAHRKIKHNYMRVTLWDAMTAYYYRPLVNNFWLFPIFDKFDHRCAFWSVYIQQIKLVMLFPFAKYSKGATIMYMKTAVLNPRHRTSYSKSCLGGDGYGEPHMYSEYVYEYLNMSKTEKCSKYFDSELSWWWGHEQWRKTSPFDSLHIYPFNYSKNDPKHYLDDFTECGTATRFS